MENKEVSAAIALVEAHLALWGEADPIKRLALARNIYTEQIRVFDPSGILSGHEEISGFIGDLLSNNPGFKFGIAKPVEVHHQQALLSWQFGPSSDPGQISGQDIFTISKGRISSLLVFVHGITQEEVVN